MAGKKIVLAVDAGRRAAPVDDAAAIAGGLPVAFAAGTAWPASRAVAE